MKRLIISFLLLPQLLIAQNHIAFFDATVSKNTPTNNIDPAEATIPFTIIEGMMLVEATTNQQTGNYIIDTGAPTLVINELPKSVASKGRGISNSLATDEIKVKAFNWSGIYKENLSAFAVDISHLEKVSGKDIAGIIGYDILKDIELLVDYQSQVVQIKSVQKNRLEKKQPIAIIPFTMQAHLPVIKVKIGKKKLRLALDTASESNILDQRFLKKLSPDYLSDLEEGEIQGVDQAIKKVQISTVSETTIRDLSFTDMPYLFTDLSHLKSNNDLYIDGLLGYPFMKQGKMSINYKERKIYVW